MLTHSANGTNKSASQDVELMASQLAELDAFDARNIQAALEAVSQASESKYCLKEAAQHAIDNRWSDILPYTHALLPGPYLNASFIPSLSSNTHARNFVCSQAPLPHTYTVFYAALAAHSTRVLVNLTPLSENGRRKSDAYWPSLSVGWVEEFDGVQRWRIRTTEEKQLGVKAPAVGELTRRILHFERLGKTGKSDKQHQLVMLHLTTWPDQGAASAQTFQALLEAIDTECTTATRLSNGKVTKGPIPPGAVWVHCSAGVGRSGTVVGALLARDSPDAVVALSTDSLPCSPSASASKASSGGVKKSILRFKSRHSPTQVASTTPASASASETQNALLTPSAMAASCAIVRHMRQRRAWMVQTAPQLAMLTAEVERILDAQLQQ